MSLPESNGGDGFGDDALARAIDLHDRLHEHLADVRVEALIWRVKARRLEQLGDVRQLASIDQQAAGTQDRHRQLLGLLPELEARIEALIAKWGDE